MVDDIPDKAQKKIPLVEVFGPTIQGEGLLIGVRTTFLRFGLCDYKCKLCDSMHAVDPLKVKANATYLTQQEIVDRLYPLHHDTGGHPTCDWVTLSGGNPCIHDLTELVGTLKNLSIRIAVETQGTMCPDWLMGCDVVTISPKSPGMGEKFELDKFVAFIRKLKQNPYVILNIKVVAFSMQDIEFAADINEIAKAEGLGDLMYLSLGNPNVPGADGDGEYNLSDHRDSLLNSFDILLEDYMQVRSMRNVKVLPQLHVLVWGNKQGV